MPESRILVISGPTACGKSKLALELGNYENIAIINADSLQIYQGLPILSAQPSAEELTTLPHFLYSNLKPDENCSVGIWLKLVKNITDQILAENKIPTFVGGSGMYISKLIDGISKIPEVGESAKKEALEIYEKIGHEEFQKKYGKEKIIDRQRLLRACEVLLSSGKPISFWQDQAKEKLFPEAEFTHVNLQINRDELYQNCNSRFEKMLKLGALDEAKEFLKLSPEKDWGTSKTLGFKEISEFLADNISQEKMVEIASQKTRNYAKRQMTWFRNQSPEKHSFSDAKKALEFLKNLK